jgi:ubiquinone/menaquinone biosynthesis C-methylase UbiE
MTSALRPRVNYDEIAHLYDAQPYREKTVDAELTAFLAARAPDAALTVLDAGCGTGNQLVANRAVHPGLRYVGVDRFLGMLRQAQPKSRAIRWVQADGGMLPLRDASVDFVTSQYMFHHVQAKGAMLAEVFRLLRPGGRFVLTNLCPQAAPDWLIYRYFPAAWAADCEDFWPPERIEAEMRRAGFQPVAVAFQHVRFAQTLENLLASVRRRDMCSQLLTIADAAYDAGMRRLEADVRAAPATERTDHVCVVTVRGDKG